MSRRNAIVNPPFSKGDRKFDAAGFNLRRQRAGVEAGLPADIAARLARATVAGSGELARLSSESADQLRRNVTSPGGTTEAALSVLMADDGMLPLMRRAVETAARRSRELAA